MTELKCGWCGKTDSQVDTLITGLDANICNSCVDVCKQSISEKVSLFGAGAHEMKCSLCDRQVWTYKRRLAFITGLHICQVCLEGCDEILANLPGNESEDEKYSKPKSNHGRLAMSELTCGWCGKDKSQAYKLIAGRSGNNCICNQCVAICKQAFEENSSWVTSAIDGTVCSFCDQDPGTGTIKLVRHDGFQICQTCVERCDLILHGDPYFGEAVLRDFGAVPGSVEKTPERVQQKNTDALTKPEEEWDQLVYGAKDKKQLLKLGVAWLRKNRGEQTAGEAVAQLLELKATSTVVSIAESWLSLYPQHEAVPLVLGALLRSAPSQKSVRLAGKYIQSLTNLKNSEPIIVAAIEIQNVSLSKRIEQAMEKYPTDLIWISSLHPYPNPRNKTSDKLFVRWMELNRDCEGGLIGFSPAMTSRSPQVIEACFNWMRAGGLTSDYLPQILAPLIGRAKNYHKKLFPKLARFARKWLKSNSDHESAGRVHAALFYATLSKSDIGNAKHWYKQHQTAESAWLVISNLLDFAYWSGTKPEQFTVDQAKILLRQSKLRHEKPRLAGALVGASADPESVAWAKEAYRRHSPHGSLAILIRLLMRAPDAESIAASEKEFDRWKDKEIEPEMIYALLNADPGNTLAMRRAKLWKRRNPRGKWTEAINSTIRSSSR